MDSPYDPSKENESNEQGDSDTHNESADGAPHSRDDGQPNGTDPNNVTIDIFEKLSSEIVANVKNPNTKRSKKLFNFCISTPDLLKIFETFQ